MAGRTATYVSLVAIIVGLVGWIKQSYISEEWRWWAVTRPYALEARDKGMVGVTLRYPYEVRKQEDYFDGVEDEKVPKDMLDLVLHIVESKRGKFQPEKF